MTIMIMSRCYNHERLTHTRNYLLSSLSLIFSSFYNNAHVYTRSHCLSGCLSVYLSICLSVCLSLSLSVYGIPVVLISNCSTMDIFIVQNTHLLNICNCSSSPRPQHPPQPTNTTNKNNNSSSNNKDCHFYQSSSSIIRVLLSNHYNNCKIRPSRQNSLFLILLNNCCECINSCRASSAG